MKKILAYNTVLAATISMIGCGGGSNNNNEAPTQTVQAQAGQPLIVSTLVDGVLVAEDTYKVYRVIDVDATEDNSTSISRSSNVISYVDPVSTCFSRKNISLLNDCIVPTSRDRSRRTVKAALYCVRRINEKA